MRTAQVKDFLKQHGFLDRYIQNATSSATVELAAQALGCEAGRIAKTLGFVTKQGPIVIVAGGTAKIDNAKYKAVFNEKARFMKLDEVETLTGHPVGGVCPFALNPQVKVYLDASLKAFDPVYPAAGAPDNAVKLSLQELQTLTGGQWIDVCK